MSTTQEPAPEHDAVPQTLSMDEFHALVEGKNVPPRRPAPAGPLAEYLRQFDRRDRDNDAKR